MKFSLLLIISSVLFTLTSCKSQQDPLTQKAEEIEQKIWYNKAVEAINNREFVLEADRIIFKYGNSTYVNANTNFISMNGEKATIQMAFNSPYAGPNGIGGITVDGLASNIKTETDKKGTIKFSMSVQGTGVSATVTIQMYKGSNQCTAIISPNFNSNNITFSGNLYPKEDSNVFKGQSL